MAYFTSSSIYLDEDAFEGAASDRGYLYFPGLVDLFPNADLQDLLDVSRASLIYCSI